MSIQTILNSLNTSTRAVTTPKAGVTTQKASVRPPATEAKTTVKTPVKPTATGGAKSLTADQGAAAVAKGASDATAVFAQLASLQDELKKATPADGGALDKDAAKAINDKIKAVAKQFDQLAAGATVGGANLLSGTSSKIVVTGKAGDQVNVTAQGLDSRSLALGNLDVSDAKSLRAAAGKIALATGKAQMAVFTLEAANGALTPPPANPATDAVNLAVANQKQGSSASSASEAVEKALNNQAAANASGYGKAGRSTGSTSKPLTIVSLFS